MSCKRNNNKQAWLPEQILNRHAFSLPYPACATAASTPLRASAAASVRYLSRCRRSLLLDLHLGAPAPPRLQSPCGRPY